MKSCLQISSSMLTGLLESLTVKLSHFDKLLGNCFFLDKQGWSYVAETMRFKYESAHFMWHSFEGYLSWDVIAHRSPPPHYTLIWNPESINFFMNYLETVMAEAASRRGKPIAFWQDVWSYLWSRQYILKYFMYVIAVWSYHWRK